MKAKASKKPNILIIVIDSLRADHASCYGYHRQTTPNIDRLAAEGCLFETAITAAPFSPASYASIFSNLYPHQHGVNGDTVRVWPNHFTRLAEKMKANGYYTLGVSNNDFVSSSCNCVRGFDVFVDAWKVAWGVRQQQRLLRQVQRHLGPEAARRVTSNRVQCAAKGESGRSMRIVQGLIDAAPQPFFGFVVLMDPHAPYDKRQQHFVTQPKESAAFFRRMNDGSMWVRCMAFRRAPWPGELRIAIDCYDSAIHYADACVGQLVGWLTDQRTLDNTIVVITSDHGEAFGENGVWGHGFCLNDSLTRVPLVVRCPRYWDAGIRSTALVQLHDVHELCVSIATTGTPTPNEHPHCLTQANDARWAGRDVVFSHFPVQAGTLKLMRALNPEFLPGRWGKAMWSVRSQEWRYVECEGGEEELYDLVRDSTQTSSIHHAHPAMCAELRERLAVHRDEGVGERITSSADVEEQVQPIVLERLRALGYIE